MDKSEINQDLFKKKPDLWQTLERIRLELDLGLSAFAELLEIQLERYQSLKAQGHDLSAHSVFSLAEALNLSFESIVTGSIDFAALRRQFHGDREFIPERYTVGAFAKRRSAINALEYLDFFHGPFAKHSVLSHFQISSTVFDHPDQTINLNFLTDFYQLLHDRGYSQHELEQMGKFSSVVNAGSPLGKKMSESSSPKELYERTFTGLMGYYDENWTYSLAKLTDEMAQVKVSAQERLMDSLKMKKPGSALLCTVKSAIGGAMTRYMKLPDSAYCHVACIHRGDPECVFEFDFSFVRSFHADLIKQPC